MVVQQGGAKSLLPLALNGTKKGKLQASQVHPRLGITINPEISFPGQRIYEVIDTDITAVLIDLTKSDYAT